MLLLYLFITFQQLSVALIIKTRFFLKALHELSSAFFCMLICQHLLLCFLCFSHIELSSLNVHKFFLQDFYTSFSGFSCGLLLVFKIQLRFYLIGEAFLHNVDLSSLSQYPNFIHCIYHHLKALFLDLLSNCLTGL